MKKIAYQGTVGSFSQEVGLWYFGEDYTFVGLHHFQDVFDHLKDGRVDFGIIPIENTVAGSVYENYDHLLEYDVEIVAEHKLKIEHNLMSVQGANFSDIKKVYSHPKALEQCDLFFENNPQIEEVVYYDTAGAAAFVKEQNDTSCAAIASVNAAKQHGLQILKSNIGDSQDNWTRFFIIGKRPESSKGADKASLIFSLSHKPGSLYHALKLFADSRLNLTKIESRPLAGKPFEYFFYVDFEFDNKHLDDVHKTLGELKKEVHMLKLLGLYKKDSVD